MGLVLLQENIEGGRLLYGILHDKSQKQLLESSQFADLKAIQLTLDIADQESDQCSVSALTYGLWQMPCGGGYNNGRRATNST